MSKIVNVEIGISTDPRMDLTRYPLYLHAQVVGGQARYRRGNREEITRFVDQIREAADQHGVTVKIDDQAATVGR